MDHSNINLGQTGTTSSSMHPYSFHVMKNHLDNMNMANASCSPTRVETDFNFNNFKSGSENNYDSRPEFTLFKAVKMGDLSNVSDYFGVAISKDDYECEKEEEIFTRTKWYVHESLNNNSEDDLLSLRYQYLI